MQFHRTKNTLSTSSWCDVSVGNSHCITYTDQKIVTWNIGITSNLTLLRNTPLVNEAAVLFFRNYSKKQIYFIRSIQQLDSPVFKVAHQSFDSTIQNNNLQLNNYLQECNRSLITYVFLTCYAMILWVAVKSNCSVETAAQVQVQRTNIWSLFSLPAYISQIQATHHTGLSKNIFLKNNKLVKHQIIHNNFFDTIAFENKEKVWSSYFQSF